MLHRNNTDTYHFPKGTVEDDETLEQTAIREVIEETGYRIKLESYLGFLNSEFEKDDTIIKKVTNYFLFTVIDGERGDFIKEHDKVLWVEIDKAKKLVLENRLDWMEKENEMIEIAERVICNR